MTLNTYAKVYKTEARGKKDEEFAFISYMDEPNSFSVISVKRLVDIDSFDKDFIREQSRIYRITVERIDKYRLCNSVIEYLFSIIGTLHEMEQLAKQAEERSTYNMNSDVVSDTEEWHKRK